MEALCWAAPFGRMAFTNYLLQSLIFGWIFYGYGLGLFGSGLPPLQRWESGFMPFRSCSAGGGSGAFASVRWNGCGAPSCTGQSSRCASVRHKDQKPALETGFLPSSIAP
jgi:hypothetical protein